MFFFRPLNKFLSLINILFEFGVKFYLSSTFQKKTENNNVT